MSVGPGAHNPRVYTPSREFCVGETAERKDFVTLKYTENLYCETEKTQMKYHRMWHLIRVCLLTLCSEKNISLEISITFILEYIGATICENQP